MLECLASPKSEREDSFAFYIADPLIGMAYHDRRPSLALLSSIAIDALHTAKRAVRACSDDRNGSIAPRTAAKDGLNCARDARSARVLALRCRTHAAATVML